MLEISLSESKLEPVAFAHLAAVTANPASGGQSRRITKLLGRQRVPCLYFRRLPRLATRGVPSFCPRPLEESPG